MKRQGLLLTLLVLLALGGLLRMLREPPAEEEVSLPVLLYHHLADDPAGNDMIVRPETLDAQLRALTEAGYTAVSLAELEAFVDKGKPLPEKPVLITFDDGYRSNYDLALPLLERWGQKAVIFAVGVTFGCDSYKDSGSPILPHFNEAEAREMADSGLIEIQSHSYDMHQVAALDGDGARRGMLPLEGESPEAYAAALADDLSRSRALLEAVTGQPCRALAYPYGLAQAETRARVAELGFSITFTTEPGLNRLSPGRPDCLQDLRRYTVTEATSPEELLLLLAGEN